MAAVMQLADTIGEFPLVQSPSPALLATSLAVKLRPVAKDVELELNEDILVVNLSQHVVGMPLQLTLWVGEACHEGGQEEGPEGRFVGIFKPNGINMISKPIKCRLEDLDEMVIHGGTVQDRPPDEKAQLPVGVAPYPQTPTNTQFPKSRGPQSGPCATLAGPEDDLQPLTDTLGDTTTEPTQPRYDHSERLSMITDLIADLPQAERREVIATLSPADRVALAKLLIASA